MTRTSLTTVAIGVSTFACATLLSFGWSEDRSVSLSVESAQARVGRPLTPVSAAGVARRQTRRAAYGYGAGAVGAGIGAGVAAVGTAAAIAATSPYRGWGSPYYTGAGYYAGGPYQGTGYYAGGPYAAYAYSPEEWRRRNGMVCAPGTLTKLDDGRMYRCQ
jgi:hypothetical protein